MINRTVNIDSSGQQSIIQGKQILTIINRKGNMIESQGFGCAFTGKFSFHVNGAFVFKEGDMRHFVRELEKVMSVAIVSDARRQRQVQQVTIKADCFGHIIGDKGEMIDSEKRHYVYLR